MKPDPQTPTGPPPQPAGLNSALARNIQALRRRRRREEKTATVQEKLAQVVTAFSGGMTFVYLHLAILAAWIAVNVGLVPVAPRFHPTFVILATAASVEAILAEEDEP